MRLTVFIYLFVILVSCKEEIPVLFDDSPYVLDLGNFPPPPNLPADNPLTIQGVRLGKMLFYDEVLSKDNSQACASCHVQADGFSDERQFSIGVEELPGTRQAMPIFNMAYHANQFFWDGRSNLLRDQALKPIEDPLEMNETLENVINKLSQDQKYKDQFKRTFDSEIITSEKMALALEQFMMSIISNDSKFDKVRAGTAEYTVSELRGKQLYETEYNPFFPENSGADCAHCHGGINFENDLYMNNGLDPEGSILDIGREAVTMNELDRGKFKVPSLRNIAITGPYMHDGRFETLEEVIEHYNSGIQESPSLDFALLNTKSTGLQLTEQDKTDLLNYLLTLTDETLRTNSEYESPF